MTKRFNIITAIVVCALLAAFGLAIAWICINKDALVSGSKIYTQEQYEQYGESRYKDGLEQNKTAEELMKKYKSELENEQTAHLKTKAELQKEKEKTNQDQARIAELEARLAAQEETLTRLSGLIESYEEIKNGTYELSFKVDGKLYKTIAVVKNGNVKNLPNDPQKEGYAFEGWVEEGTETLVDFTTYTATKDTTFTAKFAKTYEVKFVSNDVEIKTSIVKENGFAEAPATPEGDFVGWTLNGTDVVDVATTPITANTTFIARFKKWQVIKIYELDDDSNADLEWGSEETGDAYEKYRNINVSGLTTNDVFRVECFVSITHINSNSAFGSKTKYLNNAGEFVNIDGTITGSNIPEDGRNKFVNDKYYSYNYSDSADISLSFKFSCLENEKLNFDFTTTSSNSKVYVRFAAVKMIKIEVYR